MKPCLLAEATRPRVASVILADSIILWGTIKKTTRLG